MAKGEINAKADFYFNKATTWQKEIEELRKIVLGCGLVEEVKWGVPCYTHDGTNVVLIHTFKEYCALLFFKGALLKDAEGLLVQQTRHVQSARQIRFTDIREIRKKKASVKAYIFEAVEVENAGLKVDFKKNTEPVPTEFQDKMNSNFALKTAFKALTPGRQRGYILYFSSAKQSKTREARVAKCIPQILKGKGLDD